MDEVIKPESAVPDIHQQSIQYMDALARRLALEGRYEECSILHAASNLLDRIKDQSHD